MGCSSRYQVLDLIQQERRLAAPSPGADDQQFPWQERANEPLESRPFPCRGVAEVQATALEGCNALATGERFGGVRHHVYVGVHVVAVAAARLRLKEAREFGLFLYPLPNPRRMLTALPKIPRRARTADGIQRHHVWPGAPTHEDGAVAPLEGVLRASQRPRRPLAAIGGIGYHCHPTAKRECR